MAVVPDLEGYAEATSRLRRELGEVITFFADPVVTFPPDEPINSDTGRPYDPTVEPVTTVVPSASAMCTVAFAPRGDPEDATALGHVDVTHLMLITDVANQPALAGKRQFVWRDERYQITAQKPDTGWKKRWLVYGSRR